MKLIVGMMLLGLSLGYLAGGFGTDKKRNLASSEASYGTFEDLPCPTEAEFLELARRTRLKIPEGDYACDSSPKSKLARVLKFMDSLKTDLPENWGGEARETLINPLEYVIKMAASLSVDFSQTDSIAQNFRITGDVFLGGYFFQIEPLFAIAVLIHEARHSEDSSPGHDRCRSGDIPKSEGGCDAKFSIGKDAGAYGYGAIFEMGLAEYGIGLSTADREYLLSLALVHMVSRFNDLPAEFGAPVDILLVLDEDGKVFKVDPYSLKLRPIEVPEKVTKIEFSPRGAGAFFYTESAKAISWSPRNGIISGYEDLTANLPGVIDIDKAITGISRHTKTFIISSDNQFYYVGSDRNTGDDALIKFNIPPEEKAKKITIANGWSSFFLTESGDIMNIISSQRGVPGPKFYFPYKIFSESKWSQIHGGITYDQLFGINEAGELRMEGPSTDKSGLGAVETHWKISSLKKYLEGTNIRVFLDTNGKIFLARYADAIDGEVQELAIQHNRKIVDFTMPRTFLSSDILLPVKANSAFVDKCRVSVSFVDPIMGVPMGVRSSGELLGSECELIGYVDFGKVEFVGEQIQSKTKGYSPAAMKIGNTKIIPYFPRFQR